MIKVGSVEGNDTDGDDPWRYRCPDCQSVSVEKLTGKERAHNVDYTADGRGKEAAKRERSKRFRCKQCRERKPTLLDMKTGQEVTAD